MGYDMYMVHPPEGEKQAHAEACKMFDDAVEARNALDMPPEHPHYQAAQKAVAQAYDAWMAVPSSYFHLNVRSMSEARALMDRFGMLATPEYPASPAPEVYGITAEQERQAPEGKDAPEPVQRFREAMKAHLTWAPEQPEGITARKLEGTAGWVVTPSEIRAALKAYAANRSADPALLSQIVDEADWWPQWIDYLKAAADHGGSQICGPNLT